MSQHTLTDDRWAVIQPLIPEQLPRPSRTRADDRQTLNGILFVLKTGCTWADMPRECGAPTTCWRRFHAWTREGTWDSIWQWLLSHLDAHSPREWVQAFLDGRVVPAKQGDWHRAGEDW